ncbi:MAG: hypothetical protein M0Q24_01375 [Sulfurimonas sp.]|uniref:hypothetical protein n=1 Tax=Sulfurimonas sp. TaxID=2022749 RepID=UPI0025DD1393|nr:hypothetical protein [Sulfurimonas sp.]MCK9490713.1 hypothetical protein [Sulfurimonas sp.]
MRLAVSDCDCEYCHEKLTDFDYRYRGKHYCKKCYNYLFHFKECTVCKCKRKIYYALKIPICKFCQVKDKPCIRCNKSQYEFGKITEFGPTCKSCAKYFTISKKCLECGGSNHTVSNRSLPDGSTELLCQKCFKKKLPICSSCAYRRDAFSFSIETKKPLCEICTTEVSRFCKQCDSLFPAGVGRICSKCSSDNSLSKKVKFISASLSTYMSSYFTEFSIWFKKRRGAIYASYRIGHYHSYFLALDNLCEEFERIPTYEEVTDKLTVAETRKYLSVTIFLNEIGVIKIDKVIQDKYANLDMINKYLLSFKKGTYKHRLIHSYHSYLEEKLVSNKTTIRSMRLAITPAVKFLKYCNNFTEKKLNNFMLSGYLWLYPGQKAAITGFVNFLVKEFDLEFFLKEIKEITFTKPNLSKAQLKHRLISLLRKDKLISTQKRELLKTAVGYLHGISIPDNVFLTIDSSEDVLFFQLGREELYLPLEVKRRLW